MTSAAVLALFVTKAACLERVVFRIRLDVMGRMQQLMKAEEKRKKAEAKQKKREASALENPAKTKKHKTDKKDKKRREHNKHTAAQETSQSNTVVQLFCAG